MSGGATDVMRFCYAAILPFILFLPAAEALAETVNTRILNRAVELLPDESHWNRADTRECPPRNIRNFLARRPSFHNGERVYKWFESRTNLSSAIRTRLNVIVFEMFVV